LKKYTARWLIGVVLMLGVAMEPSSGATTGVFSDFDGRPVSFADVLPTDRWLVVMIWSHSCPVCAKEMQGQSDLHERHRDGRLKVLGISLDGADAALEAWAFIEEREVGFSNLLGEPADVVRFFSDQTGQSFRGTPTFLIYAPGGALKAVQAGAVPPEAIEAFIYDQEHKAD
jgi:thiol-disulfide isomerase/thioredoxin